MSTNPYFYILSLLSYSIYNLLTYKFLSQKKSEIILEEATRLHGKEWKDNEKLSILYYKKTAEWRVGSIFLNKNIFLYASCSIPFVSYFIYDKLGILYIPVMLLIANILQVIIGQSLKGRGIQISTFLSLIISILLILIK